MELLSGGSIQTKTSKYSRKKQRNRRFRKRIEKLNEKIEKTRKRKRRIWSKTDAIEEVTRLEKELQDIEIEYAAENQRIET